MRPMTQLHLWKAASILLLLFAHIVTAPSAAAVPGVRGGAYVLFKADIDAVSGEKRADARALAIEVLRKRIDPAGTKGIRIAPQGPTHIVVQLPPGEDPQDVARRGQIVGKLSFHLVNDDISRADVEGGRIPPGFKVLETTARGPKPETQPIVIATREHITGAMLQKAQAQFDPVTQMPLIALMFNTEGARRFANITKENIGKRFAIVLDGKVVSAPVIRTPILGGNCWIEGDFTFAEATEIADLLNAGALPFPLTVEAIGRLP